VVQTHISIVLLGRERVLKLKKPVDFGFLDYTTLEKRRRACEAEARLNRRLCPDVYLGAQPTVEAGASKTRHAPPTGSAGARRHERLPGRARPRGLRAPRSA
jgi:aminoglycoside phosphotransferase family enzyme